MVGQLIQKKQEEKQIQEDQAANARYWKILACYDDDDDYNFAITPNKPVDSLIKEDEHLDTIPATELDEFIKSCVENLVPNPKEIIPMKIDHHHFNAESDLIESMLNRDSSIIPSSLKIDSLLDEFAEIDFSFTPDDPMPLGIEEDDYDSERDIIILEELLDNYSLSLLVNESFHFDIPLFFRPPEKPLDGNTGILNIKMMGDNSEQKVPIPGLMITRVPNQEKSPDLLSHRGFEIFQLSSKYPMMIHGKNTSILDVPLFYFYPP
uniref:Reverse transcriptase domain-containing protein n=1 Tax=Tanacetum cinerariifolium TaxID=118510 RepID=A0A699J3K2_TANCI|nr:hypothetical protein [Tanacetum cinerariifolium]